LVSNMPSGPGIIDDEKIKSIHETIPSSVSTKLSNPISDNSAINISPPILGVILALSSMYSI